jgi:hypothetical protein
MVRQHMYWTSMKLVHAMSMPVFITLYNSMFLMVWYFNAAEIFLLQLNGGGGGGGAWATFTV